MKSAKAKLGQIVIRPPQGMREKIKAMADANGRSMNSEIIMALEQYFQLEEERRAGWRWIPPEEQVPDIFKKEIIDQAKRQGTSYSEELWAALSGYYVDPNETRDKPTRERLLRLVGEFVDLVEWDKERRKQYEAKADET